MHGCDACDAAALQSACCTNRTYAAGKSYMFSCSARSVDAEVFRAACQMAGLHTLRAPQLASARATFGDRMCARVRVSHALLGHRSFWQVIRRSSLRFGKHVRVLERMVHNVWKRRGNQQHCISCRLDVAESTEKVGALHQAVGLTNS
jgi:hypothetical protein